MTENSSDIPYDGAKYTFSVLHWPSGPLLQCYEGLRFSEFYLYLMEWVEELRSFSMSLLFQAISKMCSIYLRLQGWGKG